jgi:hypothetical protein
MRVSCFLLERFYLAAAMLAGMRHCLIKVLTPSLEKLPLSGKLR